MAIKKDTVISHYKIISSIGKGGMGEVYLAEDTKLDRKVAIKFLNAELTGDPEKLERFEQEAKAASALNHPHILTIYEIGEEDGTKFIATEFIEGSTLRKHIEANDLSLLQSVNIARQVADALTAAHEAHILHRDIKPENIMVRRDGYAKVLDFGLAKPVSRPAEGEDPTVQMVNTAPGMVMGSVKYMSPEQARGKVTDQRTDIWSLGVVLYEMVTGHNPFESDNVSDSLVAVVTKEPEPIEKYVSGAPSLLKEILAKTLKKDPSERYGSMADLSADLKKVKYDLEHDSNENQTVRLDVSDDNPTITQPAGAGNTAQEQIQQTNATARGKKKGWPIFAVALTVVIALFAGWYFLPNMLNASSSPFEKIKVEELTSAPVIDAPALSPDGSLVAYEKGLEPGVNAKRSLVVRQIATGAENEIYSTEGENFNIQTFSPDGQYIYFTLNGEGDRRDLYRIATLGGTPQKLKDGSIGNFSISPDGKMMAYQNFGRSTRIDVPVHVANIDGSNDRIVLRMSDIGTSRFALRNWSADNRRLLLSYLPDEPGQPRTEEGTRRGLASFDLSDPDRPVKDRLEIVNDSSWSSLGASRWMPNGDGIIATGGKPGSPRNQLWHVSYPEGSLRQITNDSIDYGGLEISGDGRSIVVVSLILPVSLWSVDPATRKVSELGTEDKTIVGNTLAGPVNGKLYFVRSIKESSVVFEMAEDGTGQKEVFSIPDEIRNLTITSDGNYFIALVRSKASFQTALYRYDADGSNRLRLSGDMGSLANLSPVLTDDGLVLFGSRQFSTTDPRKIQTVPLSGGEVKELQFESSDGNDEPSLSPDGRFLAYNAMIRDGSTGKTRDLLRVVEFSNGKVGKKLLEKEFPFRVPRIRWTPDSSAIVYQKTDDPRFDLYRLDIPGGTEKQISEFNQNNGAGDYVWTSDGKRLLIFRLSRIQNLILIRDIGGGE